MPVRRAPVVFLRGGLQTFIIIELRPIIKNDICLPHFLLNTFDLEALIQNLVLSFIIFILKLSLVTIHCLELIDIFSHAPCYMGSFQILFICPCLLKVLF